jgi:hypothetical protein
LLASVNDRAHPTIHGSLPVISQVSLSLRLQIIPKVRLRHAWTSLSLTGRQGKQASFRGHISKSDIGVTHCQVNFKNFQSSKPLLSLLLNCRFLVLKHAFIVVMLCLLCVWGGSVFALLQAHKFVSSIHGV